MKRILEVACGPGTHSLHLAKTMLQRGSAYVIADIAEEMVKEAKCKFEEPKLISLQSLATSALSRVKRWHQFEKIIQP